MTADRGCYRENNRSTIREVAVPRQRTASAAPDQVARVVLYVRVSALMGRGDDLLSPDIQTAAMRRRVAGMREIAVIDDDIDVSGRTFSRKGLDKIRRMVERREVDVIAVYDVSRLGRNVVESLKFLDWIAKHDVTVISASEQLDTSTPAGKLMLNNFLSIAQYRGDEIGNNWALAIDALAKAGRHHGKPYGYRRVNKRLVPDPITGPIVEWAWRAYAAEVPIGEIAAEVAARRGKPISTGHVKTWFRSPVYLGHVVAAGEVMPYTPRDGDPPTAHPPLVDQATWDAVQKRLARDAVAPSRHLEPTWALVGLVCCPSGHRLQRSPTKYRGEPVDRLICGMTPTHGMYGGCEGIGYPRLDRVEAEVLRQVGEYQRLLRIDDAAQAARLARSAKAGVERATVDRELARTRAAMAKLATGWAKGDVPDAAYHGPMAELRASEVALLRQSAQASEPALFVSPSEAADAAAALLELWPQATMAERGRMLRAVVVRVVVRRAEHWREPEENRVTVEFA